MKKRLLYIICISCFLTIFSSITSFAQNRIDYGVSQQAMLSVVYDYIHGTNTPNGNYYNSRVYCSPAVYLDAGKCYIDWVENRAWPYTKETAFQAAVQKYSLTSWKGTYDIEYQQNQVIIRLSTRNMVPTYNSYTWSNPTPTQNQIIKGTTYGQKSGGLQIPTTYVYTYGQNTYSQIIYIKHPDYWTNAENHKQYLQSCGYNVIQYYPSNGIKDLEMFNIKKSPLG